MVAKTFTVPFAKNGNKTPIPNASDPSGFVSYDQGYGPDYERQLGVDPLAKDISRENFNQALSDITVALQEIQSGQGQPAWSAAFAASLPGGVYPKGAIVPRADSNGWWISLNATAVDPATSAANWAPLGVQGSFTQALTNVNVTPTVSNAAYPVIVLTGALTGNVQLILPNWVYAWQIINNCTGSFTVTVKTAAGAGVVVANSNTEQVVGNGTNILTGQSSTITQNRFDATDKLASTRYVQLMAGNASSFEELTTASRTITIADAGKTFIVTTATTLTFPDSTTLPSGFQITIIGAGSASVALTGSSFISSRGAILTGNVITGFSLLICSRPLSNQYRVTHMGDGPASLSGVAGYKIDANGLITQWGTISASSTTTVTATNISPPINFPNACFGVTGSRTINLQTANAPSFGEFFTGTTTAIRVTHVISSGTQSNNWTWVAIGN